METGKGRVSRMGSNERGAIIGAGLTGSAAMVGIGFKLAFPNMIVPFGWAMALISVGLISMFATIAYAVLWLVQPKSRRQRIQMALQPRYEKLSQFQDRLRSAQEHEEVVALTPDFQAALTETADWISDNMSSAAFEKFKSPKVDSLFLSWPSDPGNAQHRSNMVMLNQARLEVLDTFLRYDGWDGEEPRLRDRIKTRIAKWKSRRTVSTAS